MHLHNLHGRYFSPFALSELTALKPTVWTLHDMNPFTGHCAYSMECGKWMTGCHNCLRLEAYPNINHDASKLIYDTKRKIYENCAPITLIVVSKWLEKMVRKSILKDHDIRLIYNGIDETIFKNYDKNMARKKLGLPLDKKIVLFCANGGLSNQWKGGEYFLSAYKHLSKRNDILFICIGSKQKNNEHKNYYEPGYIYDKNLLAMYYASSDIFLYPSISDTLGLVVTESLSCGTPVITFDTGGIPEQVTHMETGYIAKPYDIDDLIAGIHIFLDNQGVRRQASILARKIVVDKFSLKISLKNYENLYYEVLQNRKNLLQTGKR